MFKSLSEKQPCLFTPAVLLELVRNEAASETVSPRVSTIDQPLLVAGQSVPSRKGLPRLRLGGGEIPSIVGGEVQIVEGKIGGKMPRTAVTTSDLERVGPKDRRAGFGFGSRDEPELAQFG